MSETRPSLPVLSERLDAFLTEVRAGRAPNFGTFCPACYTPVPAAESRCDHCGRRIAPGERLQSVPPAVVEMHRRKQRRESLIVNTFAYVGLFLGVALFLIIVAIDVIYLDGAIWLLVVSLAVLIVGSRVLAGIVGGVLGDEIAYRYVNRRLAEEWAEHARERDKPASAR